MADLHLRDLEECAAHMSGRTIGGLGAQPSGVTCRLERRMTGLLGGRTSFTVSGSQLGPVVTSRSNRKYIKYLDLIKQDDFRYKEHLKDITTVRTP